MLFFFFGFFGIKLLSINKGYIYNIIFGFKNDFHSSLMYAILGMYYIFPYSYLQYINKSEKK